MFSVVVAAGLAEGDVCELSSLTWPAVILLAIVAVCVAAVFIFS